MRPSTVRRLVRTVPLAAVVAGATGYVLLPADAGADARPRVAAAGPTAPTGVALVAPVAEAVPAPAGTAGVDPAAAGPTGSAAVPTADQAPTAAGTTGTSAAPAAPAKDPAKDPVTVPAKGATQQAEPATRSAPVPAADPAKPPVNPATPPTPATSATSTATSAPAWPEQMPGAVGEHVDVSLRSLSGSGDWRIRAGGSYLDFEVTWTNATDKRFDEIVPVVRALPYDYPAAVAKLGATAKGLLDRKDLDEWREAKLTQEGGVDNGPQVAAFALDPGESRAVRYRLTLAADSMSGRLPIAAEAYVGRGAKADRIGGAEARLNVAVDRPVLFSLGWPTPMTVGRIPTELGVELANLDAQAGHTVAPVVAVTDPLGPNTKHGLVPADLIAEVYVDGEWRRLQGAFDTDGLVRLDTSVLTRSLGPGETARYSFRVNVPKGWNAGSGLEFTVGGTVDGQALPTQKARPLTYWMPGDRPKELPAVPKS
ncbi:hypothetical protein [Kitasatospora sp. NPDC093806]|uniref:hypothetical protein n=1 Tax=Kitasatospora sp. NPDC093806 TaxID=3155075 RepID=UPI0034202B95